MRFCWSTNMAGRLIGTYTCVSRITPARLRSCGRQPAQLVAVRPMAEPRFHLVRIWSMPTTLSSVAQESGFGIPSPSPAGQMVHCCHHKWMTAVALISGTFFRPSTTVRIGLQVPRSPRAACRSGEYPNLTSRSGSKTNRLVTSRRSARVSPSCCPGNNAMWDRWVPGTDLTQTFSVSANDGISRGSRM